MDKSETIENFEELLKNQGPGKTIALYSGSKYENSGKTGKKHSYTAHDILTNVSRQLKAIQSADSVKMDKRVPRNMYMCKRSSFVNVNMLQDEKKVRHKETNFSKFEQQCVSDTQLINIIQDAEALDTHKGVTQEFETSFIHTDIENKTSIESTVTCIESMDIDCIDGVEYENNNDYHYIESTNNNKQLEPEFAVIDISLKEPDPKKNINLLDTPVISHQSVSQVIAVNETETQMNKRFENLDKKGVFEAIDRPSSPIFGIKPINKKPATSPLVFDLEAFEKFEQLAAPIIEETSDIETAKYLINSQTTGKQMCLCINTEPIFNDVGGEISFIHTENNDNVKIEDSIDVFTPKSKKEKVVEKCAEGSEISMDKKYFQDEILFSSDEEVEYMHKNVQELPFTCVLETSFYEHLDVLDKSMYVGFQTASNKSIQICTDSFFRAKSLFHNMTVDENEPTLTELVEKCDAKENSANIVNSRDFVTAESFKSYPIEVNNMVSESKEINLKKIMGNESISNSNGFKTASEKSVDISKDGIIKNKPLFQDIDNDVPNLPTEDHFSLTNPSQFISKPNYETFSIADNKKIKLSNIASGESKNIFHETITLRDLQLDTCNDNAIENIKNKITENISDGLNNSVNQDNFIETHEKQQLDPNIDDDILKEFEGVEMSQESINRHKDSKEKVTGFKTASNNNIIISDAAVAKTKYIFQNIDLVEEPSKMELETKSLVNTDDNMMSKQINIGFKTASNKQIQISEQALAKTRNIFQDIDSLEFKDAVITTEGFQSYSKEDVISSDVTNSLIDDNCNRPSASKVFIGFKTANNKDIKISNEALYKTKNMFKDIEKDDYMEPFDSPEPPFQGFKRASNENDKMSIVSLSKSKETFVDIESNNPKCVFEDLPTNIKGFAGFHTASNKKVTVSKKALDKSKKLFADIEVSEQFDKNLVDLATNMDKTDIAPVFKGFQTASMKPVEVSAIALAKSKVIFQDIDQEICTSDNIGNLVGSSKVNIRQTDNNKESKNRKMFEEIDEKEMFNSFKGFQTASKKQVKISDEALAKSRKILDEIRNIHDSKETCAGANNEEVKISDEALTESRKIFQESDNRNDNKETSTGFKGFQTANHKQVKISKEALDRSRQLFQDIDIKKPTHEHKTKTVENYTDMYDKINSLPSEKAKITCAGFKTANSGHINVSEAALLKSRKLFADIDNDQYSSTEHNINNLESKLEVNTALKDDVNLENIINTQVINNFEQTLYTEDFCKETPRKTKRSGSPILSCPKSKKRKKFEIPYSQHQTNAIKDNMPSCKRQDNVKKTEDLFVFDNNYKKNKKYQLKDLKALEKQYIDIETHIDPYVLNFEFEKLGTFEFKGKRNDITDSPWTTDDLKNHFQESVNKKFIPEGWIENHLKLIMWKLISYEIKFPKTMSNTCTARNVIDQLKYRYDKELYNAERPAVRKIMEKDDMSSRTIVLCIVAVFENGVKVNSVPNVTNNVELLLTDGWYCIKATTDKMLSKMVADGKIVVGSKIVTNGAELVNCEQGVSPWEDTSSIRLKLSGNSTRRARWDARLGYHGDAAILCPLSHVSAEGGRVSKLRVLVTRVYPALYVEKFEDGSTVTRSERLEHQHQMRHEAVRQAALEKIYEEVEKEFSDQDSQDSDGLVDSGNKRKCLDSGSQIAKVMKTSRDPLEFRSHLTDTQRSLLQEHTTKKREKLLQDIQRRVLEKMEKEGLNVGRNVIRLLKVRVAGAEVRGGAVVVTRAMMSIWKPTDAVLEMISEGCWMEVMNVVPTAVRYSEMQLSAGRQSVFSQSKHKESDALKQYTNSLERTCYPIKDLAKNPSMTTDYNEIDTVGLVFLIEPSIKDFDENRNQFQNVYLADEDKNLICANFWGGLKKFGFENVLDTGQVVACTNLQKRAGNTRKSIPQYRVTEFVYFTKTPKNEGARKIAEHITMRLSGVDKKRFCEDCVVLKNNYSSVKLQRNSENITPYRFQNIDINATRNRIYIDSPLPPKRIDDNLNLTGLDFESTFKQRDTQELSPKALLRKKRVNEKIAKLEMYGEPPPLSPIQILNRSKNAGKAYRSPLHPNSDVSSVASEKKIVLNEQKNTCDISCSPILMNRTFVKRNNVNPVKLNFASVAIDENVTDHFAEDFDASPPLSLD